MSKNNLLSEINKKGRFVFIIPCYNHAQKVRDVILETLKLNFPVFVVDDGSTDSTFDEIKGIKGIILLHHKKNKGKGAAIMTGMAEAVKTADWVITIDADGQHNPKDAIHLIQAIPNHQRPIVVGMREKMNKKDIPWTSRFGRKFSNFWVLLSGGPAISDSQCGFRIYPLPESMNLGVLSKKFQFEVEILVKANWKKIPVIEAPVSVNYQLDTGRISHFRPVVDFFRNANTFTRLIFQRILIPQSKRKQM